MKKFFSLMLMLLLVMTFVFAGCGDDGGDDDDYDEPETFKEMFSEYKEKSFCEIGSDGSYIKFDTNPYDLDDYYDTDAWAAIEDACDKLGFSEATLIKMGETRSIDGRQTASSDGYSVSWSYHPDQGMEVLFEVAN